MRFKPHNFKKTNAALFTSAALYTLFGAQSAMAVAPSCEALHTGSAIVTNAGDVFSSCTLSNGQTLDNHGQVAGTVTANALVSPSTAITNYGRIEPADNAIDVIDSNIASVTNTATGTMMGDVFIENSTLGSYANAGSHTDGWGATQYSRLIVLDSTVTRGIDNSGQAGNIFIENSSIGALGIINSGELSALQISDASIIQGAISNTTTGIITNGASLQNASVTGNILNHGQLLASGDALHIQNSQINGAIVNSGMIDGAEGAIRVLSSTIKDASGNGFDNQAGGEITAAAGSFFYSDQPNVITIKDSVLGHFNNSGTITGGNYFDLINGVGISDNSSVGAITNNGTITSLVNAFSIENSTVGSITNNGTLTVTSDGDAGGTGENIDPTAIYTHLAKINGDITNQGQINANNESYYGGSWVGDGMELSASVITGNVINTGTIISGNDGISISDESSVTGNIVNSGWINSDDDGITIADASSATGNILNSGQINAGGDGIYLDNSQVNGNIHNTKSLIGDTLSYGQIIAVSEGIDLSDSILTGDIINDGIIDSGDNAIELNDSSVNDIINHHHILASDDGMYIEDSTVNSIINNGTIDAGDQAIEISDASVQNIINTGRLIAGDEGLKIEDSSAASITNTGEIDAGRFGIFLHEVTMGDIYNAASGAITSYSDGILINSGSQVGNITNDGRISVIGEAYVDGYYEHTGIYLIDSTLTGSLTNNGQINATPGDGWGIWTTDTLITENVINTGAIHADHTAAGFEYSEIQGSITNSGSLTSNFGEGMMLDESLVAGDIINSGTITAQDTALAIYDSTAANLINSGAITGESALHLSGSTLGDITNTATGSLMGTSAEQLSRARQTAIVHLGTSNIHSFFNHGKIEATGTATAALEIDRTSVSGEINNSGSIIAPLANHAVVITSRPKAITFNNSGTIDGHIHLEGRTNSPITLNLNSGSVITGNITGANTLVNVNAANLTYAHNIADTASPLSAININPGASLATTANNVFSANSVTNQGTLGVGAGNTLTVNGDYTQAADASLKIGASSTDTYGKLLVNGTANFAEGTGIFVDVTDPGRFNDQDWLHDVISAGTLNATSFKVDTNSYLFGFEARVDGNSVDLGISEKTRVSTATNNLRVNQAADAATVLDQQIFHSPSGDWRTIRNAFAGLTSEQQVADAATQTLPLLTAGTNNSMLQTMNLVNRIINARQSANSGLSAGDATTNDGFWLKAFGSWADQDNRRSISGYDADSRGVIAGVDYAINNDWRLGGAFTYSSSDVTTKDQRSQLEVDAYSLAAYGSYAVDYRTEINFQVDLGSQSNQGARQIAFGGLDRTAASDYDSSSFHVGSGVGRTYALSHTTSIIPSLSLDYNYISNDGYTETGADALNLKLKSQSADQLISLLDTKVVQVLSRNLHLSAHLGLGYDFLTEANSVAASFVGGGGVFITRGIKPAATLIRSGAALHYTANDTTDISLHYDRDDRGSQFAVETLSVKARFAF